MQDVIIDFQSRPPLKHKQLSPWELSLRRVARAQAILWHQTPIIERMAILARVEQEMSDTEGEAS